MFVVRYKPKASGTDLQALGFRDFDRIIAFPGPPLVHGQVVPFTLRNGMRLSVSVTFLTTLAPSADVAFETDDPEAGTSFCFSTS